MPPDHDLENTTIQNDLQALVNDDNHEFSIFLFHSPPYHTMLDQATIRTLYPDEHSTTLHVGSKAIRNFINQKQPYITMHGLIHESAHNSGEWKQQSGRTWSFSPAHDGSELALI